MRNSLPWGDAYIVSTPAIDRVAAMIQQEERQRQAVYQRSMQDLDKEFSKNVSGMRDADIPELSKKWGEYKQKKLNIFKNGRKMSNEERIASDLDAQRTLGDAYGTISKSKSFKEREDGSAAAIRKNGDDFEDDATQVLVTSRSMPLSQLEANGFTDLEGRIKLKTTDFTKIISNAIGKPQKRGNSVENNGLTSTLTEYTAINSPDEVKSMLDNSLFTGRLGKNFASQLRYDDRTANDIIQKYEAYSNTTDFKKAYPNQQPFDPEKMNTPQTRATALFAMENALQNPITATKGRPYNNTGAVMDRNESFKIGQQQRQFANAKKMSSFNDKLIRDRRDGSGELEVGYPTVEIANAYGEVVPKGEKIAGLDSDNEVLVYNEKIPVTTMRLINPTDANKLIVGVDAMEVKQKDGTYKKAWIYDKRDGSLRGKEGRKIGMDDARALYIDDFATSKGRVSLGNTGRITKPSQTPNKGVSSQPKKAAVEPTFKMN